MTSNKIALFDMDGTLCDYVGTLLRDLESLRSPIEPVITSLSYEWNPAWLENRMDMIKTIPGWWAGLPKLHDGFAVLRAAAEMGFKLQVCTKGPNRRERAWEEKYTWCRINIDGNGYSNEPVDITVTTDKSGIYGTVLVEDWPPYVEKWLKWRKRGTVILMDRPYNQGFSHPRVMRYTHTEDSTHDLHVVLRNAFNREPGDGA